MGNKNDYMTLEESAQRLGRPLSVLKTVMSEGKISAMLSGGRWLISVRELEKLRASLPPEPMKVVHNQLSRDSPRTYPRTPKLINTRRVPMEPISPLYAPNRCEDVEMLDAKVRNLAAQIEVRLSYLEGGKAVWNRLREDNYKLNSNGRAAMPKDIVSLLDVLRKTKQKYIVVRETDRYKQLLRSLPEWNLKRIAKAQDALDKQRGVVAPAKSSRTGGIEGFHGGSISDRRFWFNEED